MPVYPVNLSKRKTPAPMMPMQNPVHQRRWMVITVCVVIAIILIFGIRALVVKRNATFNAWYEARQENSKTEIFQRLDASDRTVTANDRTNMFKALGSSDATLYDADRAALYQNLDDGAQDAKSDAGKEWRSGN